MASLPLCATTGSEVELQLASVIVGLNAFNRLQGGF
jgi:hypothetical protein